jgi:hypothetical protein
VGVVLACVVLACVVLDVSGRVELIVVHALDFFGDGVESGMVDGAVGVEERSERIGGEDFLMRRRCARGIGGGWTCALG